MSCQHEIVYVTCVSYLCYVAFPNAERIVFYYNELAVLSKLNIDKVEVK